MHFFFYKICNGRLHFKALLLTANVMAQRLKMLSLRECSVTFVLNVTFNDLFDFKVLNVASRYIFKCQSDIKVKNGGEYLVFLMNYVLF